MMITPLCRAQHVLMSRLCFAIAIGSLLASSGCQLLPHQLQPHQLWKINRGRPLGTDTYDFSVPPMNEFQETSLQTTPPKQPAE